MKNLQDIKVEEIEKIYSGKPGCMCGCRGKYYTDEKSIKRIIKNMIVFSEENKLESDGPILYCESANKSYVLYLK